MVRVLITAVAASAVGLVAAATGVDAGTPANIDVVLAAQDELIEMGGTGQPTVSPGQLSLVIQAVNDRYGTSFGPGSVDNLQTPEGFYSGTYNDGEIDLLNGLGGDHGDTVTVFGVSQSAGIIGMAIRDIASGDLPQHGTGPFGNGGFADNLNPGLTAADLPSNIHWLALAPPSMPQHDNAAGLFQQGNALFRALYPHDQLPFPTDTGNADVYCGMYDPICDAPTTGDLYAQSNSSDAVTYIHGGYGSLSPAEFDYEMSHATEFTIGPGGAVTIYPDQSDAPAGMTSFYLMPDIHNFDTTANPDYDSYLPALAWIDGDKTLYQRWLPYDTLQTDAGYDDALHPFEYTIGGTEYTFYNDHVIAVADLPAGVSAPIVDPADVSGQMGELAQQIANGAVSPTGVAADAATDIASDPNAWSFLTDWL